MYDDEMLDNSGMLPQYEVAAETLKSDIPDKNLWL